MWVLLQAFWKPLAIVVAVGLALGYVKILHTEINHYKSKATKIEAEFDAYRDSAESMQAALKSSNAALTLRAKQQSYTDAVALEAARKSLNERVKNDEASKRIAVPDSTVRVLNESTLEPGTGGTTATDSNHAGDAGETASHTLNEVLAVSVANNVEHWACIKQVEEWQVFWKTFEHNVKAAKAQGEARVQ